ncbi:MAG: NmrA family transcriptional regulator [Gammaproteobacteria bacterium]|nr:NmrA family transcriptional regulator [Pseudomonadales bacterium]
MNNTDQNVILVTGGTGKTGRRIARNLQNMGRPTRVGSRASTPAFDWNNPANWKDCLDNVEAAYISYAPDLAMPGASDTIQAFVDLAVTKGVKRLVVLSGRGEEEAQTCEQIIINSGLEWTVVRASWFFQNFSEGAFIDMVLAGQITVPAGNTLEPFVDVDDISDVATVALAQDGHNGQIYEVTGPRLMSFTDIAADLSAAIGRDITYHDVPHDAFVNEVKESGAPRDVVWMLDYLFATVLDGRNSSLTDGVQRALGRKPRDFRDYAIEVAKTGVWRVAA